LASWPCPLTAVSVSAPSLKRSDPGSDGLLAGATFLALDAFATRPWNDRGGPNERRLPL